MQPLDGMAAAPPPASRSRNDVFAGRSRLGAVEFDGLRFVALDLDGAPLASCETAVAAVRAVCEHDRQRREVAP